LTAAGAIDRPQPGTTVYQHSFDVVGWAAGRDGKPWRRVRVRANNEIIGSTSISFRRPDVAEAFGVGFVDVGFSVRCRLPEKLRTGGNIDLICEVEYEDDSRAMMTACRVHVSGIDYRARDFGGILVDEFDAVLPRSEVYTSGSPATKADEYCAQLVRRYIAPGESVLDVGCGVGAWSAALTPFGLSWSGCEARADFVDQMQSRGLPATLVTDRLPFADASFDVTICIEVLEHVVDPAPFLTEVSRVS
jgi:hypothetical protein